ncbi:hypothetical protein GH877_31010, partial [Bacillus thuringiensis]|nr:hypothetical protein [Bacillus thuringiensis]
MSVENYDGLKTIIEKTIGNTCDAINECERNPCANGGRCINMHGQFYCKCRNEYTGLTCERRCRARSDVIFVLDAS